MVLLSKSIASGGLGFLGRRLPAFVGSSASRGRQIVACSFSTTPSKGSPVDASGFDTAGIIGLGLMGHGVCQIAATSGVHSNVVAFEKEQRFLDSGRDRILKSIDKLVKKEKMTSEFAEEALGKIDFTTDIDALKDVDFIVEAVVENIDLKRDLYTSLGDLCKPETIFASNTSSLSIAEMASFSKRPDRFVGVHFFNPVQLMKVVEVVRTNEIDPIVLERSVKWVEEIGKVSVLCDDTPGFIVNRILVPSLMQAMALVDRKEASVKDVDVAMKLGCGHPMGPMHLADYIGLDTCHSIVKGWTDNYPDEPAFFIPTCLQEKVDAGDFGRKTGKGFYHWEGDRRGDPVE